MRARWAAVGAAVAVSMGAGVVLVANAATDASNYRALTVPCRILDTRTTASTTFKVTPLGMWWGTVGDAADVATSLGPNDITVIFDEDAIKGTGGDATNFTLDPPGTGTGFEPRALMGDCDSKWGTTASGADLSNQHAISAVTLNVAVVGPGTAFASDSFLTIYPWKALRDGSSYDDDVRPFFANLNPLKGLGVATNQVTVSLSTIGGGSADDYKFSKVRCTAGSWGASDCSGYDAFKVFNQAGDVHVIIDVVGYYWG